MRVCIQLLAALTESQTTHRWLEVPQGKQVPHSTVPLARQATAAVCSAAPLVSLPVELRHPDMACGAFGSGHLKRAQPFVALLSVLHGEACVLTTTWNCGAATFLHHSVLTWAPCGRMYPQCMALGGY
jgi:hypothetical protein